MARFVEDARQQVLATAKELMEKGLVEGTAGHVSACVASVYDHLRASR